MDAWCTSARGRTSVVPSRGPFISAAFRAWHGGRGSSIIAARKCERLHHGAIRHSSIPPSFKYWSEPTCLLFRVFPEFRWTSANMLKSCFALVIILGLGVRTSCGVINQGLSTRLIASCMFTALDIAVANQKCAWISIVFMFWRYTSQNALECFVIVHACTHIMICRRAACDALEQCFCDYYTVRQRRAIYKKWPRWGWL